MLFYPCNQILNLKTNTKAYWVPSFIQVGKEGNSVPETPEQTPSIKMKYPCTSTTDNQLAVWPASFCFNTSTNLERSISSSWRDGT